MNRTINILSTSRTALILLLATLLNATTPCTASRSPTNPSPTAATRNDCQL